MDATTPGRCASCRFWAKLRADDFPGYTLALAERDEPPSREVLAVGLRNGWGECELARMRDGTAVHPESLAATADGEDYKAALVTAPAFGCVQWQPHTPDSLPSPP